MTISDILQRLQGVREVGPGEWFAICPAHQDTNASLHLTATPEGGLKPCCFSGCDFGDICQKLGIERKDWPHPDNPQQA